MLTVKIVDLGGNESVFHARHVVASRRMGPDGNVTGVECLDEHYEPIVIRGNRCVTHGRVYVMNDNGKTVANYYLAQDGAEK